MCQHKDGFMKRISVCTIFAFGVFSFVVPSRAQADPPGQTPVQTSSPVPQELGNISSGNGQAYPASSYWRPSESGGVISGTIDPRTEITNGINDNLNAELGVPQGTDITVFRTVDVNGNLTGDVYYAKPDGELIAEYSPYGQNGPSTTIYNSDGTVSASVGTQSPLGEIASKGGEFQSGGIDSSLESYQNLDNFNYQDFKNGSVLVPAENNLFSTTPNTTFDNIPFSDLPDSNLNTGNMFQSLSYPGGNSPFTLQNYATFDPTSMANSNLLDTSIYNPGEQNGSEFLSSFATLPSYVQDPTTLGGGEPVFSRKSQW